MKSAFKYGATGLVALLIGIGIGSSSGGAANSATPTAAGTPVPTATVTQTVQADPLPAETVTVTADAPAPDPAAASTASTSTCDDAREAILTGSAGDIDKALKALQNDKSAPSVAREYSQYYLVRDAGSADLRQMDTSLITSACN